MSGTSLARGKAQTASRLQAGDDDAHRRVVAAARSAVRKALKAHKAAGAAVVVWKNGKVIRIPANKISV